MDKFPFQQLIEILMDLQYTNIFTPIGEVSQIKSVNLIQTKEWPMDGLNGQGVKILSLNFI